MATILWIVLSPKGTFLHLFTWIVCLFLCISCQFFF